MRRTWRMAGTVAVVVAAGSVLAACSSNTTGQSTGTTLPTTTTTSGAGTTSTSAATTTSTTAATTTTATIKCKVAGLRIQHVGGQGAAGTEENTFSLTNTATATCTMYGYPGMQLLDTAGQPIKTTVVRGGGNGTTVFAPTTVSLAGGAVAYFNVTSSDVTTSGTTCSSGSEVEITPPTNTTHATLPVAIYACDNGKLDVSPVFGSTNTAATQTTAPAS